MNKQPVKAVIFDLDGTLANTLPLCIHAFRLSVQPLIDRLVTDEEIIATFGPSEEGTIMALAPGHYDTGVAHYLLHYEKEHHLCAAPFEGIIDLLKALQAKNIPIAMVTGKGKHSTAISLQKLQLASYFEWIETGSPQGPRKAEGIQLILDKFPYLSKEEILYVGDAPSDIVASRKVGIPVVAAAWAETAEPGKLVKLQPDALFYSVPDFAHWLLDRCTKHK